MNKKEAFMSNRLTTEDSPYLQHHKENPIHWFAWCDEAFEKAHKENKPIFISIGYSTSYWCRVMEKEVFKNEEIASFVNNHYVCIKVDREERPDIDKYYQEVYQILNRRPGGWPMSIFATPENKPFYAGSFIPLHSQDDSLGFTELTSIIAQKVAQQDHQIFTNASDITTHIKQIHRPTQATKLSPELATIFLQQAQLNYQSNFGGFSVSPKFPHTSTLHFLLNMHLVQNNKPSKDIIIHTLKQMQRGGFYDLVEGGFCRYSVDETWLVPHFEKTTYDNALLIELYACAYKHFKEPSFLKTAQESATFMLNSMCNNELFYSVSDAKYNDENDKYFLFSYDEIHTVLHANDYTNQAIEDILHTLHVTPSGNFEGQNIIRFETDTRPEWFENVQKLLLQLRQKRQVPFLEQKILLSYNAMLIRALFVLGSIDEHYILKAQACLDALLNTMLIQGQLYHTTLIDSTPKVAAFLEDYAYLGAALLEGYQQTFDERYIIMAQQLTNQALEQFYDKGRWLYSRGDFEVEAATRDSAYPGEIGVMVDVLLSLGTMVDEKYKNFGFKTLEYYSFDISQRPLHFPYMSNQIIRYVYGDRIIKGEHHTLLELNKMPITINYPYTIKQAVKEKQGFEVCNKGQVLSTTTNPKELNQLIQNSF